MATCPACKREVQGEQQECPYCGVIFSKFGKQVPRPPIDSNSVTDMTRKKKYLGLGLIILGTLLEVYDRPKWLFWVGMVIVAVGLASFVRAYGRSATLAFWALLPIAPFFILIGLPFENLKKSHPQPMHRLSWGVKILCILFGAGCLAYMVYFALDSAQQMEQNSAPLIQALSKYKNDHARFPEILDELVPQYVSEIPKCKSSSQHRIRYSYLKEEDAYELNCITWMFNRHRYRSITKQWDNWD